LLLAFLEDGERLTEGHLPDDLRALGGKRFLLRVQHIAEALFGHGKDIGLK
jgi:hypothetical protein